MNSIKDNTKMDTIFMNSKNRKISDPHTQSHKWNELKEYVLKTYVALSNLSMYYTCRKVL